MSTHVRSSVYFRKYHKDIFFADADLNDDQSVQNLCNNVMNIHKTGIDILVNNAGWCKITYS